MNCPKAPIPEPLRDTETGTITLSGASPEHLLVFYTPERAGWEASCERLIAAGFVEVSAHNPYWGMIYSTIQIWGKQEH